MTLLNIVVAIEEFFSIFWRIYTHFLTTKLYRGNILCCRSSLINKIVHPAELFRWPTELYKHCRLSEYLRHSALGWNIQWERQGKLGDTKKINKCRRLWYNLRNNSFIAGKLLRLFNRHNSGPNQYIIHPDKRTCIVHCTCIMGLECTCKSLKCHHLLSPERTHSVWWLSKMGPMCNSAIFHIVKYQERLWIVLEIDKDVRFCFEVISGYWIRQELQTFPLVRQPTVARKNHHLRIIGHETLGLLLCSVDHSRNLISLSAKREKHALYIASNNRSISDSLPLWFLPLTGGFAAVWVRMLLPLSQLLHLWYLFQTYRFSYTVNKILPVCLYNS